MKKLIYIIVLITMSILDLYIILESCYYLEMSLKNLWRLHLVFTGIFWLLNKTFLKMDINYFDVLIILFPGIGFGGLLFVEILPEKRSEYSEIEESLELKSYISDRRDLEYIDISAELGVIGAYDHLLTGTSQEKKKFLMGFNPPEISFKVDVLKKSLLDEDTDVIHYAATELNNIDESFQKEISERERSGDEEGVFESHLKYIRSKLLDGEILSFYQERALKLLLKLSNEKFILEELELLRDTMRLEECELKLEKLLDGTPNTKILNFALRFFYERNHYNKVLELRKRFPEEVENISVSLLKDEEGVA